MSKKRAVVIVVIVIVALAAAGLFIKQRSDSANKQATHSTNTQATGAALLGETYTSQELGVRFRLPKGWKQAKILDEKLAQVQFTANQPDKNGGSSLNAYGLLKVTPNASPSTGGDPLTQHVQPILDASVKSKYLNKSRAGFERYGNHNVSYISYEQDDANSMPVKLVFYSFYENNTFYDFSFLTLPSAWETHRRATEATVASFERL